MLDLEPTDGLERQHLDDPGRTRERRLLLLAQPEVGDGGDLAGKLPRRGLRRPAHIGRSELAEPRQRPQPLDHIRLGREQLLAAEPEPFDQPVHVQVGPGRVDRADPGAVQLQEHPDPLARLRRHLRRLGGGGERRDHVQLATPRDLGAPRDVDRTQLDRRPRQRPHDRRRIGGIGEQPQPRQHVPDLGALEERLLADEAMGHRPLLERHRDRLPLTRDRRDQHHDRLRRHPLPRDQPFDVGGDRLGLGAVGGAAPELDRAARLGLESRHAHRRAPRRQHPRRAPHAALQPQDLRAPVLELPHARHARASEPPQGLQGVAGRREIAPPDRERQLRRREIQLLDVVDQQVVEAAAATAPLRGTPHRAEHHVAGVDRARVGQHPLMHAIDLRELPLEGRAGWIHQTIRPRGVVLDRDQLGLELVDPPHEPSEERVGAAPEVVVLQFELVDPVEQHRQAIARPEHRVDRLRPRLPEHERRQLDGPDDVQLLVSVLEHALEPLAQRVGTGRRRSQHREPLRPAPELHKPPEPRLDHGRLTGAGAAQHEQRPAAKCDRFPLSGKQVRIETDAHSVSIDLR